MLDWQKVSDRMSERSANYRASLMMIMEAIEGNPDLKAAFEENVDGRVSLRVAKDIFEKAEVFKPFAECELDIDAV